MNQILEINMLYLGVGHAVVAALLERGRVDRPVVRVRVVQLGVAERCAVGPGCYGIAQKYDEVEIYGLWQRKSGLWTVDQCEYNHKRSSLMYWAWK